MDYARYLRSQHWQDMRRHWFDCHPETGCAICGIRHQIDLHHLTYERLWHEELDDLIALCHGHHSFVHRYFHYAQDHGIPDIDLKSVVSVCRESLKSWRYCPSELQLSRLRRARTTVGQVRPDPFDRGWVLPPDHSLGTELNVGGVPMAFPMKVIVPAKGGKIRRSVRERRELLEVC